MLGPVPAFVREGWHITPTTKNCLYLCPYHPHPPLGLGLLYVRGLITASPARVIDDGRVACNLKLAVGEYVITSNNSRVYLAVRVKPAQFTGFLTVEALADVSLVMVLRLI